MVRFHNDRNHRGPYLNATEPTQSCGALCGLLVMTQMATKLLRSVCSLMSLTGTLVTIPAFAADWQNGVNYGGTTNMNLYVPDNVADSPGVVVALHSCGNPYEQDSQNYARASADEYGFVIIQPTNGTPDCWTANAGQDGEKPDIIAMVNYVLENHNADAERVYAVGASSGACMTLALMATHPDVFSAGATLAGVPYGAWTGGASCSICSQAAAMKSEQEWGDIVRDNAPNGFTGPWPRIQLWHGTGDTTLVSGWLAEAEKQWKNVHSLTGTGTAGTPPAGWTRTEYAKDGAVVLQVNSGAGKDHYLPDDVPQAEYISFFGLDVDSPPDETTDDPSSTAPVDTSSESVTSQPVTTAGTAATTTGATSTPTSAPSSDPTPASTTTTASPTTVEPNPVTPPPTPSVTSPAGSTTSAPGNTDTGAGTTTTGPIGTTGGGEESGCQCQLGTSGQPLGAVAGLIAAGMATLIRRRRSS